MDLRRVLTYCNDSFSCRRTHILDPFEDDAIGTGGKWLQNLRTTMFDFRDCDKCDVCEERNTRSGDEWFQQINETYLTAVDRAFRNDLEASIGTLANRICATEGVRTTVRHAEEIIEYLAVAGYLTLDISFRGKGFVTMVRPRSMESGAYRPIPIPYDIKLEPAPSVAKPRQQRLVKQMQLQNGSREYDSSDDELTPAEGEQEDGLEDVTIVRPLRNRKRKRSESAEPEIAKRPCSDDLTIESLVKRFEEKAKKKSRVEQAELGKIKLKTLRGVFARHLRYFSNIDAFKDVLKEVGADEEEITILTDWYKWIEDEVLYTRNVVNQSPAKYHVEMSNA